MPNNGEQVDAQGLHVHVDLAGRLRGIAVDGDAARAAQRRHRVHGLHRARLVVGVPGEGCREDRERGAW